MKQTKYLMLCASLLISTVVLSQTVSFRPFLPHNFDINQLANINISYSGNEKQVFIKGKMVDEENNVVLNYSSTAFSIQPNKIIYSASEISINTVNYNLNSSKGSFFSSYSSLPYGEYEVCVELIDIVDEEELSNACSDYIHSPISIATLLTPGDRDEITTIFPLFTWLPPTPIENGYEYFYDLKIVDILENQSPEDAIQRNIPLVFVEDLTSNYFNYPGFATPLQSNKSYAWQVQVKYRLANSGVDGNESVSKKIVGTSEVYEFNLIANATSNTEQCFVQLKDNPKSSLEKVTNQLDFIFYNQNAGYNKLAYQILEQDGTPVNYQNEIDLKLGFNQIRMTFKDESPLQIRKEYLLKVISPEKEQFLRFIYLESNN